MEQIFLSSVCAQHARTLAWPLTDAARHCFSPRHISRSSVYPREGFFAYHAMIQAGMAVIVEGVCGEH